jgi:molecular chaperone GrpE (heat shock protein)
MGIVFKRGRLYEQVWASPLTELAKKYGMSDSGIRKVCKAMNIPLPVAGHWAKVAAGKPVRRPPLPPDADTSTFVSNPPEVQRPFHSERDDEWLAARIGFEARPENHLALGEPPKRWHSAIAPLRDALREEIKDRLKQKRDAERAEKHPYLAQQPGYEGGRWKWFCDSGQLLLETHRRFPLRITMLTWERAIAILDAICRAAEKRGFSVALDEKAGRIVLDGHGAKVEMRMAEKLGEASRKELGWDKKMKDVKCKVPAGALRLYVGEHYHEKEIAESEEKPLEQRLNDVFVKIYGRVVRAREWQREQEAREREWEERERRAAEAEKRRLEAEAKRAAERRKREKLVEDAKAWQTANLIRSYLAHLDKTSGAEVSSESGEWMSWAKEVADEMDPTAKK